MGIEDTFKLEIEGIVKTIKEYSTENFINSYAKQILTLNLPEDEEKITLILNRLLTWYQTNITDIKNSEFIINKHEHQKAMNLLTTFHTNLAQHPVD